MVPVMKQIYTAQEYAVRAIDTIDHRQRRNKRAAVLNGRMIDLPLRNINIVRRIQLMKIYCKTLLLVLLALSSLEAQFIEVNVDIDSERLDQNEQQLILGLDSAIEQFFLNSVWGKDIDNLDMIIDVIIAFQSTVSISNERNFQAQIMFTNRQDQRLFVKAAKFPYYQGRSLNLTGAFDPLTALLAFHGYMLIAGELDTYGELEGSAYYAKANLLAAESSREPRMTTIWGSRIAVVEVLIQNQDGRRAKSYFFQAIDAIAAEEPDPKLMKIALDKFYTSIEKIVNREGLDRSTAIFLQGHAEELSEMLAGAGMWVELENMIVMHPDSDHIYKNALENR